jgi:hypothetical protein
MPDVPYRRHYRLTGDFPMTTEAPLNEYHYNRPAEFSALLGKTILSLSVDPDKAYVRIQCSDNTDYLMCHQQDCCEDVSLADIVGDIADVIGSPIFTAAVLSNKVDTDANRDGEWRDVEICEWTFYRLGTKNGEITMRWCGTSNGYYSTEVNFYEKPIVPDYKSDGSEGHVQ